MEFQELELKYFVNDLGRIEEKIIREGAQNVQPRILEINLRFDTPDNRLSQSGKVLRLRFDTQTHLTYKGPSQSQEGIRLREEIEFIADNFQAAKAFLIALGYQISMIYEKYRTTYVLNDVHIMLDELPYGKFVEIEGPSPEKILYINELLGLDWQRRVPESYAILFERLRHQKILPFRDLVFDNFKDLPINADDLEIQAADQSIG
jgi:adenylate cyclase class 2